MVMKADFKIIESNVLLTTWHNGPLALHEVKEIMERMLVIIKENNIKQYIDDISECDVDWEEADKWIVNDWYVRALKLGVEKNALIVPQGVVMQHKDEQCEIKSFSDYDTAMNWVRSSDMDTLKPFFESARWTKFNAEQKIFIILLLSSVSRQLLGVLLSNRSVTTLFIDFIYCYLFYFFIAGVSISAVYFKKEYSLNQLNDYCYKLAKILGVLLPSVPLFTFFSGNNFNTVTIDFFRYIPTFEVERNFFPTGMIFVIPLLVYLICRLMKSTFKTTLPSTFFIVSGTLLLTYLIYYQYNYQVYLFFKYNYSEEIAVSVSGIIGVLIASPAVRVVVKRLVFSSFWFQSIGFVIYALILLGLVRVLHYYFIFEQYVK